MLALVALLLAVEPDAEAARLYGPRSTVQLELFTASGGSSDGPALTSPGPPLTLDVEAGLRVWRPQWVDGGGRPVALFALHGQHSFYDSRNTLTGLGGLGAELWRWTFLVTAGYGFGFVAGLKPQPTVALGLRISFHLGPVSIGAGYERQFLFRSVDRFELPRTGGIPGFFSIFATKVFDLTD